MKISIAAVIVMFAASALGQKLDVKIVDRQDNETEYSYVVPGHFSSQANTNSSSNANCYGNDGNVNCSGSGSSTTKVDGYALPARQVTYRVRGATFTLQLPDGRLVVVNCESKFAEHFAGRAGNHRSCRKPLVDNIQVDFNGDKAKLQWIVSLDGKKTQSETYKVLAVLDKPKPAPANSTPEAQPVSEKK